MNINFSELEELKNHLADALGSKLAEKIEPLVKRVEGVESQVSQIGSLRGDVDRLKANQAKALIGWTVMVTGVTLAINHFKVWIQAKLS